MKTDLKTPLKIKGCGDVDSLFDVEGNYMADVTDLPPMLEVVRRVNAYDAMAEALDEISRFRTDNIEASEARNRLDKVIAFADKALRLAKEEK